TRLARLAREGNLAEARPLHYRLLPLIDANFLETNPAPAKCALHLMGRIENVLRLPLVPVSETTRRAIAATLEAVRLEVAA
ncbi:MAG: dihydrodipicolinate synthase family protein, partial [Gemmatimonadales bacterium]|nr:dihydrodipicolinate synthase family protein [Gemmatimonadales bacterium]